ncbi:MAG TPA: glycoside hydrolase family 16 protein [Trebonia sp.]|nr:glycoside hydrolase family 16 protein [Trebonia sp.]
MASLAPLGATGSFSLDADYTGAQLAAWPRTEEGAANLTAGTVSADVAGNLVLRTSGVDGNFAGVESPRQWQHGYFEARVWLADDGRRQVPNWPAFWLLGNDWPSGGELDVLEIGDGVDGSSYWYNPVEGDQPDKSHGSQTTVPGPASSGDYSATFVPPAMKSPCVPGWHTAGILWAPGTATIYKDGRRYCTFSGLRSDVPMNVILNNTQGENGKHYGSPVPSDFKVEYFRHWALAG